jgi:two-component system, NtrC family, response regulator AtoC
VSSELEKPTDKLAWEREERVAEAGFSLVVVRDGQAATHALPAAGSVLIGRSPAAEIRIDDGSVSREHARLHIGPGLRIEDLGSSNGTRARDQPLRPNVAVEIFPDDVIDLGTVLLVVQYRRLTQRLRRTTSPAFLQLRVEEECQRGDRHFAVARFAVEGGLSPHAVQLLLSSHLRASDLIAATAPGEYRILLCDLEPAAAEKILDAARTQLAERGVRASFTLRASPRDGRDPQKLLDGSAAKSPPSRPIRPGVIAEDEAMLRVYRLAERIADSEISVLILGETGAGKEVIAELLHQLSPRAKKPLVKLNCAAIPEALIDSELFGHEKGAFTGAVADKVGLLESASGGTVFLDEIGDMPLNTQVRLLRVLEAREVMRVGALKPRPIDVRVVSATHRDLAELVTAGRFREDLYYRLNGISVIVPPLRERMLDIEPLARHFLSRVWKSGKPELSTEALTWLKTHDWPGNVRELRNVVERAAVLCEGTRVEPRHLPIERRGVRAESANLRDEVKELERERIVRALEACNGNQRRAAVELGISRGALLRRLEQLGIPRPRKG